MMSLVDAICEECNTTFSIYKDSIVHGRDLNKKGKYSDILFYRNLCPSCFYNRYKKTYTAKFLNMIIELAKERYPEFGDDKWIVAHLL
jgi:hypothetical protein